MVSIYQITITQPVEAPVRGVVYSPSNPDIVTAMCKYLHDEKRIPMTEHKGSNPTQFQLVNC